MMLEDALEEMSQLSSIDTLLRSSDRSTRIQGIQSWSAFILGQSSDDLIQTALVQLADHFVSG